MLRFFQWIVQFFEWIRAWDDRLEAAWLNSGWQERLKWWLGASIAMGVFAFVLVCVPGAVLLEVNRLFQLIRFGTYPAAGLMYAGLWNFAVAFAAVTLAIAFISCPLYMLQARHRER